MGLHAESAGRVAVASGDAAVQAVVLPRQLVEGLEAACGAVGANVDSPGQHWQTAAAAVVAVEGLVVADTNVAGAAAAVVEAKRQIIC